MKVAEVVGGIKTPFRENNTRKQLHVLRYNVGVKRTAYYRKSLMCLSKRSKIIDHRKRSYKVA